MVRFDKDLDTEVDSSRVREALAAARDLSKTAEAPWGNGGPSRGRSLGRGKRLGALVAEKLDRIGLDAETVERELVAERAERQRRLGQLKADAVAQSGPRAETQRHLVEGEVVKLDDLVLSPGDTTTHYFGLDSPVQIYGSDGIDVESTTIEAYHSRAKIRRDHSYYPGTPAISDYNNEAIHFQYLWQNPRPDVYAVVSVSAILMLNGFCTVHAPGGVFTSGSASLFLKPTLSLVQPWTQPISVAAPQPGQTQTALHMHADTHDFLEGDETLFELVYRGLIVDYQQEFVPPGQYLIIDVALTIEDSSLYGEVSADFATGEFYVMSPLVQLAFVFA